MIVSDTATAVTVYKKKKNIFQRKTLKRRVYFVLTEQNLEQSFYASIPQVPQVPQFPPMAKARTHKFDLPAKGVFNFKSLQKASITEVFVLDGRNEDVESAGCCANGQADDRH